MGHALFSNGQFQGSRVLCGQAVLLEFPVQQQSDPCIQKGWETQTPRNPNLNKT